MARRHRVKIVVIGSGLIGLTSAYFLRRSGHEVTVLDRQEGSGLETSFANGALLTPSMAEPWNAPGCWRVLLASLGRSDAALQLHFKTLPSLAGWGIKFLRNSSPGRYQSNALSNLRLALYSLKMMETLRQETGIEYGRNPRGSLRVFRDVAALDRAFAGAEHLLARSLSFRRLSSAQCVELEPALAPIAGQLAGGIHYEIDEIGDAHRFCVGLTEHARRLGVEFRFGTVVSALEMRSSRVMAVASGRERFVADRYIMAACSYSTPLLRQASIRLPVRPAKGYSVTFEAPQGPGSLRTPIVDDHLHAAIVPLPGALRTVGTAEFAGFDRTLNPDRIGNLKRLMQELLPQESVDPTTAKPWCGLRAMSADGVPIIGATAVPNLLVNTGHGHLGWTMAAGSAKLLTDLVNGAATALDPASYALARF